jgi:outer membrane receptor protein involved in Fe transport
VRPTLVISDVYHAHLRHGLALGSQHTLTGGLSYRLARMDSPGFTAGDVDQHLLTFFLQDEWAWRSDLALTVGVGIDVHSEARISASPRGSLVYSPWKDHTFRVAVAKAFRNPSLIENFGAVPLLGVLPPPQTFAILDNRDLDPEEILSYELGYQTVLFERLKVRIDLFYNQIEGLIIAAKPIVLRVSPLLPPLSTAVQFINTGDGDIFGGEIGFDVFITSWLTGFLNYSYQERKGDVAAPHIISPRQADLSGVTAGGPFPESSLFGLASHHKANMGINVSLTQALSATLLAHYVGEPEGPWRGVNPYTIVNLRLSYRFRLWQRDAEVAVQAFNLFNDVHREVVNGDLIDRRVSGTIRMRF